MDTYLCNALSGCIGGNGHWGKYGYMYMGCYTHRGLVSGIECGDCVPRATLGYSAGA
jgi:hypothetical protein